MGGLVQFSDLDLTNVEDVVDSVMNWFDAVAEELDYAQEEFRWRLAGKAAYVQRREQMATAMAEARRLGDWMRDMAERSDLAERSDPPCDRTPRAIGPPRAIGGDGGGTGRAVRCGGPDPF